jgi:hypothetical protein
MIDVDAVRAIYEQMAPFLDERGRRLWTVRMNGTVYCHKKNAININIIARRRYHLARRQTAFAKDIAKVQSFRVDVLRRRSR